MNYLSGQDQLLIALQLGNWVYGRPEAFRRTQQRCANRITFFFWN